MAKSRLGKKYQTTVPREVRDELGLGPGDVLVWDVVGGAATVAPESRAFLARRGSIEVGPGSTVEEIRRARRQRGRDFSTQVVEGAAAGEEVGTANAGRPLARLKQSKLQSVSRRPGAWKGQVWVAEDFDAPLPPEMAAGSGIDEE